MGLKLHFPVNYDLKCLQIAFFVWDKQFRKPCCIYETTAAARQGLCVLSISIQKRETGSHSVLHLLAPPLMDKNHLAFLSKQNLSTTSTTVLPLKNESRQECSCIIRHKKMTYFYLVGKITRERRRRRRHKITRSSPLYSWYISLFDMYWDRYKASIIDFEWGLIS